MTETHRTTSPADFEVVSVDTVKPVLAGAGVPFARVRPHLPGVVHIQGPRILTIRDRQRWERQIIAALDHKKQTQSWRAFPTPRINRKRVRIGTGWIRRGSYLVVVIPLPHDRFTAWVAVRDAGREWHDGQGRNWHEHVADPGHPGQCCPGLPPVRDIPGGDQ